MYENKSNEKIDQIILNHGIESNENFLRLGNIIKEKENMWIKSVSCFGLYKSFIIWNFAFNLRKIRQDDLNLFDFIFVLIKTSRNFYHLLYSYFANFFICNLILKRNIYRYKWFKRAKLFAPNFVNLPPLPLPPTLHYYLFYLQSNFYMPFYMKLHIF